MMLDTTRAKNVPPDYQPTKGEAPRAREAAVAVNELMAPRPGPPTPGNHRRPVPLCEAGEVSPAGLREG